MESAAVVVNDEVLLVVKRIALGAGVGLLLALVLLIAFAYLALPLFRYLSRPADPALAKRNGEALAQLRGKTVVAVVAHPDDAEWYVGGTLGILARRENRVVVVLGTSGEKGGNGIPNLAAIREAEQKEAGRILDYSRIVFLRNPDRDLTNNEWVRAQLRDVFEEEEPAALFTFDAERQAAGYRHSDHIAAGEAALAVAKDLPTIRNAYLFSTSSPDVLAEIGPVLKAKGEALSAHQSQRRGNAFARTFFQFFRFLPHTSGENLAAGSALTYKDLGVSYAEPFRRVSLRHEE